MVSLYVVHGNDQWQRFDLPEAELTIGRDTNNYIHLKDAEVSRLHALIEFSDGHYLLRDTDSINGIFVNGCRKMVHPLKNGDQILLGQTLLLFTSQPRDGLEQPQEFVSARTPKSYMEEPNQVLVHPAISHDAERFHSRVFSGSDDWNHQLDSHLRMMYHTALVTSQTLDIDHLLHRILDLIFEWIEIDRGCIMLFDSEARQLIPTATRLSRSDTSDSLIHLPKITLNKSIVGYVMKRCEGVLTNNAQNDPRWPCSEQGIREVICVPMVGRYGLIGIIYTDTFHATDLPLNSEEYKSRLSSDHIRLMVSIAHQTAIAVEGTQCYSEMIHAERLATVGQTVATLSHHIKNILQGISGGSHLIEMGLSKHNEELIRQGWGIVDRNQTRISKLILDMLMFSKEREPAYELGNIDRTIRDVVELMQLRAVESNVEILFRNMIPVPDFYFDAEQIHRALTNLVTNGIDATLNWEKKIQQNEHVDPTMDTLLSIEAAEINRSHRKGVVLIESVYDPESRTVTIAVDDNGPGIPKNRRASLFRPFYSEKKGRGTGLGLSVVRKVVQEHGGAVHIEDSTLGGARFVVEIPFKREVD